MQTLEYIWTFLNLNRTSIQLIARKVIHSDGHLQQSFDIHSSTAEKEKNQVLNHTCFQPIVMEDRD